MPNTREKLIELIKKQPPKMVAVFLEKFMKKLGKM